MADLFGDAVHPVLVIIQALAKVGLRLEVFKNLTSAADAMLFCFQLKKPVTHKTSHCAKFRLQAAAKL